MSFDKSVPAEKSTNGRSFSAAHYQALRAQAKQARADQVTLGALSLFAPHHVEVRAADLFGTPSAARSRVLPEVPGIAAVHTRLSFRDGSLSVSEWGQGPAVLLAHGWNGNAAQLQAFVAPLVAAGRRVVTFDQPAHGRSSGSYATIIDMAGAVRAVADAHGPFDAIIAHSLGATASALAVHWGLPVARMVLLAPPGNVAYFAGAFAQQLGLSPARADGMLVELKKRIGELSALDLTNLRPSARTTALVLHDRGDREVPFEHGAALASAWPGTRFVALDGLGHRKLLRDPGVIQLVTAFAVETHDAPHGLRPLRAA